MLLLIEVLVIGSRTRRLDGDKKGERDGKNRQLDEKILKLLGLLVPITIKALCLNHYRVYWIHVKRLKK